MGERRPTKVLDLLTRQLCHMWTSVVVEEEDSVHFSGKFCSYGVQLPAVEIGSDCRVGWQQLPVNNARCAPPDAQKDLVRVQIAFRRRISRIARFQPLPTMVVVDVESPLLVASDQVAEPCRRAFEREKRDRDVGPHLELRSRKLVWDPNGHFPDIPEVVEVAKHRGLRVSEPLCQAPARLTGILFNGSFQDVKIEDRRASRVLFVFEVVVSVFETIEPSGGRHMRDSTWAHRLVDSVSGLAC